MIFLFFPQKSQNKVLYFTLLFFKSEFSVFFSKIESLNIVLYFTLQNFKSEQVGGRTCRNFKLKLLTRVGGEMKSKGY